MLSRVLLGVVVLGLGVGRAAEPPPPKLAVVIVVDQLRADYLVRFRPYFAEGGFARLLEGGAVFTDAHHRHAITHTAPGHATILSGVHANVHSIVSNDWLDRRAWEMVNAVEDHEFPLVGITPAEMGGTSRLRPEKAGRSPRNCAVTTVGDQLKLRFGAGSKVFAASNKDRSAILLGGKLADGAYWDENGRMVTSRYYRATLPAWVEAFNAQGRVPAKFGATWDRLLAPDIYDRVQGPDDAPGETTDFGFTRTFPKAINGGATTLSPAFYTAFDNSPFSAELLSEFVQQAVREEQLGRHAATDLLCVSFSQVDTVGHNYGPDSHEVMDAVLRLDRVLAGLLDFLDREIGLARCVVLLTADHGVAPLPEHLATRQPAVPAGRVNTAAMDAAVAKALDAAFGPVAKPDYWFTRELMAYHLRPTTLEAKKIGAEEAARVVKQALLALPHIAHAFTRAELLEGSADDDSVLAMCRRSYHAERGRDVVFVVRPYFMIRSNSGVTHGTPYNYETHVPLLWFGAGVPRGLYSERAGIDDVAPTLAALLGVVSPPQAQGRRLF